VSLLGGRFQSLEHGDEFNRIRKQTQHVLHLAVQHYTTMKYDHNKVTSLNDVIADANPDHVRARRLLTRRNVLILLIELFALPSQLGALKAPAPAAPTLVAPHEYA